MFGSDVSDPGSPKGCEVGEEQIYCTVFIIGAKVDYKWNKMTDLQKIGD